MFWFVLGAFYVPKKAPFMFVLGTYNVHKMCHKTGAVFSGLLRCFKCSEKVL